MGVDPTPTAADDAARALLEGLPGRPAAVLLDVGHLHDHEATLVRGVWTDLDAGLGAFWEECERLELTEDRVVHEEPTWSQFLAWGGSAALYRAPYESIEHPGNRRELVLLVSRLIA